MNFDAHNEYIGCPDITDKDAFAARVHGDSMQPDFWEGDIVIFSPALEPKNGDRCFVRFENGHTTFKVMHIEGDSVKLSPINLKYKTQSVPRADISGMYVAMFKYS